jgi:hypothetical protein
MAPAPRVTATALVGGCLGKITRGKGQGASFPPPLSPVAARSAYAAHLDLAATSHSP